MLHHPAPEHSRTAPGHTGEMQDLALALSFHNFVMGSLKATNGLRHQSARGSRTSSAW